MRRTRHKVAVTQEGQDLVRVLEAATEEAHFADWDLERMLVVEEITKTSLVEYLLIS